MDEPIAFGAGWALACWRSRHMGQRRLVGRFALGFGIIALAVIVCFERGGRRGARVVQLALIQVAGRLGLGTGALPRLLGLELGRLLDLLLLGSAVLKPILSQCVSARRLA